MAKFDLKFIDAFCELDYIQAKIYTTHESKADVIQIKGDFGGDEFQIFLDKSTAIKFSKTIRTEINKITVREEAKNE